MTPESITGVIAVLNDMRAVGIIRSFAIGGAFAAILHNEPLSTIGLDIFFLLSKENVSPTLSLSGIYDYAREKGFSFDHEFINIHGWLVQFVEAGHNPLWRDAINEAQTLIIEETPVPLIGREYLVAMWLYSGRTKDYQKIAMFCDAGILDLLKLFQLLDRYDLRIKWEREKWRFVNDE